MQPKILLVQFSWSKDYKKAKITKQFYVYKVYASTYNVEILNYFIPELPLKDTEFTNRIKLKDLLTEMKGFKFVTTLELSRI